MEKEMISVIIPTYNCERRIRQCVASIQNQSYQNLEIIIVNDGSTDSTGEICDNFKKKDLRIQVIHQDNKGVSAARNIGISHASGHYIQFVDSDDIAEKDLCEKLIKRQRETGADLVICGYNLIEENKSSSIEATNLNCEIMQEFANEFAYYLERFLIHSPWNKLYLKGLIKEKFDEKYSLGEDLLFNIAYLKECNKVAAIRDPLYNYYYTKSKQYNPLGEDIATNIYCTLKRFVDNRLEYNRSAINAVCAVYINDTLYNIRMACRDNDYSIIRKIQRNKELQESISTSAGYVRKSTVLLWINRLRLWWLLWIYFKCKNFMSDLGERCL